MPVRTRIPVVFIALFLSQGIASGHAAQNASIDGTVTDGSGGLVLNARVELRSGAGTRTTTTGPDGEYRFVHLEPGRYDLTVAAPGFRIVQRNGLQVRLGEVLTVPIVLEPARVEELLDVRPRRQSAGGSHSLTAEELLARPGARDPLGFVTMVPGVVFDRLDSAGSESLSDLQFIYRGTRSLDMAWTIDGIVVTDRQTGRSPGYYDVDSLAELQFAPASRDIARPGSGLGVNMVFRSGTDQLRATARGFLTGEGLQGSRAEADSDHTRQVHEYGADLGGPLARGRAWFMASASERETRLYRAASGHEQASATPLSLKLTWQATGADRLNFLWLDHPERRFGINPSAHSAAPDALQDQTPLYPGMLGGLWKIEDARAVGAFALSARYAYYGTGFNLLSRGTGPAGVSEAAGRTIGATVSSWSTRPQHTAAADASLFGRFAGLGHELRLGGGWQQVEMRNRSSWPALGIVGFEYSALDRRARVYRDTAAHSRLVFGHFYAADTMTSDRLTIDLGLRLDHQRGESLPIRAEGNPAFPDLVPSVDVTRSSTPAWIDLSPRVGLRYGLTPSGRVSLRASAGRFASQQVLAVVAQTNPANVGAWIEYPWDDLDGDRLAQPREVRTDLGFIAFEGLNPLEPGSPVSPTSLDSSVSSRITSTASLGLDAEFGEHTQASLAWHYARHTDWPAMRWVGLSASDYLLARHVSTDLPNGSRLEVPIFVPDATVVLANGARRTFISDPDFYTTYRGIELTVRRRMHRGWELGGTAAWNDSRAFYRGSPPTNGFGNPTRLDGATGGQLTAPRDPLVQGGQIAPATQPSTNNRTFLNARWQVSATATVLLPWQFEATATVTGREGSPSPYIIRQSLGLDGNRSVLMTPRIDTVRLDDLWNLDARLARSVRVGPARVQLLADLFNVTNAATPLVRDRNLRSASFDRVLMRVNPRILRLGLRISY